MQTLEISTSLRAEFIDITLEVEHIIRAGAVSDGIGIIYCPHTTAALTINENADPAVKKDIIEHLAKMVPCDGGYAHLEGNADAHIKAALLGSSLTVIISNYHLVLGRWQGVYFCEFDGPRQRKIYVQLIPASQKGI